MRVKHYLSGMMMAASTLASPAECHSCHHLSQEMIQQPLYDTLSKAKESPSALKVSFAQDTISEDLNYQELMNVSVRKLIRTYGLEKALLIVQECNLQAINTIRAERRLSPLHLDSQLTQAAQNYAEEMSTHKFFSHRGKDGSNHSNRIKKTGYV